MKIRIPLALGGALVAIGSFGNPTAEAAPITGKYGLGGRAIGLRLELDNSFDRQVTRLTAPTAVRRKKIRMALMGKDESNESYDCGWVAKFQKRLKNGPSTQRRMSTLNGFPCDGSRWSGVANLTWKKRAGGYRLSVRMEVTAVSGRDTGDTAKIRLNGKRD